MKLTVTTQDTTLEALLTGNARLASYSNWPEVNVLELRDPFQNALPCWQRVSVSAYRFFRVHAGGVVGENARTAIALARAERYAIENGWQFEWRDDWKVGSHVKEFGKNIYAEEPNTCESCILRDSSGEIVASLGCIDDATAEYRRVVKAELAMEGMP